jgi:hypothetical protein
MNWYIAKLVFNISAENQEHAPQFDEQLRLIAAADRQEAFIKARIIGLGEEDAFFNDKQNKVKWEFINVADIFPIQKLEDGTEIYSNIYQPDEARAYINQVHQKAIFIRSEYPMQVTGLEQ